MLDLQEKDDFGRTVCVQMRIYILCPTPLSRLSWLRSDVGSQEEASGESGKEQSGGPFQKSRGDLSRSESLAVFWMHKLRILSVRDVLSIWNKVALSSCPLWLPLDYVFCADHDNDCLISSPSSSRPFRMDLSVGLVLKNRESNHQTHCLPNVPSKSCSTYPFVSPPLLVSIIGDKYQCSVSVTARTDSPYYRRPPYAFMPCTKCNEIHDARTQCADDTELEMSKWWMTWNWKEQICAAKCLMTKWRIFAEHVCSGCHWLFVDELYCFTVSLCVFGVLSVFLLLVFDWSYYNLFGGTFILKLLFKLLCAQTVDISMICTFWTWTCRSPTILLVYDEELTVAMSPMRHPLSIPFLILPKCTTMRDPSFLFDFIDSMFECSFADAIFSSLSVLYFLIKLRGFVLRVVPLMVCHKWWSSSH